MKKTKEKRNDLFVDPQHQHDNEDETLASILDVDAKDPIKKKNNKTQPQEPIDTQEPNVDDSVQVKIEDEDDDVIFIGSRPCHQPVPFPLPVIDGPPRKRKRALKDKEKEKEKELRKKQPKVNGRPKKYLWDEKDSESDFVLSDIDEGEWILLRSQLPNDNKRKTSRWVCYSEIEEKMFLHWLVQGRSLNYVVNAFKGLRSRNGLYQKMAATRRQFDNTTINISKENHYATASNGVGVPGPIPREDLQQFKLALYEMKNKPSLKQRISGEPKTDSTPDGA